MEAFVSIIIPTYNSEVQLGECLTSIANQDYKHIEVVVMDAMSTDDTLKIIESFKNRINISLTSEKDNGIYDAMNKGIKKATGEWILFMGSDDSLYDPKTLNDVFNNNPDIRQFDVIYGDVVSDQFGGRYGGEFTYTRLHRENICHQAIFFKRILFDKLGYFDMKFIYHADWEYNFRWMGNKELNHNYIDKIICNYSHGGVSSTSKDLLFPYYHDYVCYLYGKEKLGVQMKHDMFKTAFSNLLRVPDIMSWLKLIYNRLMK